MASALNLGSRPGPWRNLGRLAACLAVVTLVLTGGGAAGQTMQQSAGTPTNEAAEGPSREYLIKAAILYNFAKFTRWPAESFDGADAPLRLCVFGADPFGAALATIDGKRVGTRNLHTRLIAETTDVDSCHLLFVSASERDSFAEILAATNRAAVLTVADSPGFSRAGGIITLSVIEDRARFEVNRAAAEHAGLQLSAKLLRLADSVIQERHGGDPR